MSSENLSHVKFNKENSNRLARDINIILDNEPREDTLYALLFVLAFYIYKNIEKTARLNFLTIFKKDVLSTLKVFDEDDEDEKIKN